MNMEELKVTIALMVGLLVVLVGNLIMTYICFQFSQWIEPFRYSAL